MNNLEAYIASKEKLLNDKKIEINIINNYYEKLKTTKKNYIIKAIDTENIADRIREELNK